MIDTTYNLITWKRNRGESFHFFFYCNVRTIMISLRLLVVTEIISILFHFLNFYIFILHWNLLCVSAESGGADAEIADN